MVEFLGQRACAFLIWIEITKFPSHRENLHFCCLPNLRSKEEVKKKRVGLFSSHSRLCYFSKQDVEGRRMCNNLGLLCGSRNHIAMLKVLGA